MKKTELQQIIREEIIKELNKNKKIYPKDFFKVGDKVKRREWNQFGEPLISREYGYVKSVSPDGKSIWIYWPLQKRELEASHIELVPA